ncbi:MAG: carbohydrate-binding domain-containing protein [Bacteroidaceae bacterium]|nr:carbohydrate-binding domain-containing protein [Bacteroidaceae bacterium]
MRKFFSILLLAVMVSLQFGAVSSISAQTLSVRQGSIVYQFPAAQAGEMSYNDGTTVTIMGKTFKLAEIDEMTVGDAAVTDNLVEVVYNGTAATVTVAGNVAQYIMAAVSGAHVTIVQNNTAAVDGDEITYQLSGSSSDGSLSLGGEYKCTVALAGVTLTNPSDAAITIINGKRIQLSAKKGTVNTLADGTGGDQKACIYSKGQLQLQGNGTLNVKGNTKHAIKSGDYISVKNLTLNVTKAVSDGINCEEYFQMKSGTVTISGVGDDGIQCDLGGDASTGETEDHEDEDSGNVYLEGGTLTVTATAAATKGIKAAGDMRISDGVINVTTTGNGAYDSEDKDAKGCAGLKSDGNMTIAGGTLTLKSTGTGGKCIKADGTLTVSGGTTTATSTGSKYTYSSSATASAKAVKADGNMTVTGGSISATASSHEAIETKGTLTVTDGTVYALSTSDDAINSAGHMYLKGGTVTGVSNGNDGIDSNGNLYISGGVVIACGAGQPECGLDAAERYYLYITGGTVLAIGGGNNTVTATTGSQCVLSTTGTTTAGTAVSVKNGTTTLASFTIPTGYSPSSGGGGGGFPGGGGGRPGGGGSSSSFSYLLSCGGLTSGTSYSVTIGTTTNSCKAATSYSGR